MSFWEKMKSSFYHLMQGRYGADELGQALLWTGVVLSFIQVFTGIPLLGLVSLAIFIWEVYRLFSRDTARRGAENSKFLSTWNRVKRQVKQWINRIKHGKEYKYFKCPQCKAPLRLPRKVGTVTVTCKKCQHRFDVKA